MVGDNGALPRLEHAVPPQPRDKGLDGIGAPIPYAEISDIDGAVSGIEELHPFTLNGCFDHAFDDDSIAIFSDRFDQVDGHGRIGQLLTVQILESRKLKPQYRPR